MALIVIGGDGAGRELLCFSLEGGRHPRENRFLDLLERLAGPLAFPLRETHLRHDAPLERREFELRLHDVALGAGDVALIAVEDGE